MELPQVDPIRAAIYRLADQLHPVSITEMPLVKAWGRVLAAPLRTDRDSPPLDVAAMDGYAVRISEAKGGQRLPVVHTAAAGEPPIELPPGSAVRIFTGAPVPSGAQCVVRREDTDESSDSVQVHEDSDQLQLGKNIRRQGENAPRGTEVLPAGVPLVGAAVAAAASFSAPLIQVRRRVSLVILNTGNEIVPPGSEVKPWQIRDSNGPLLENWIAQKPWLELLESHRVDDRLDAVVRHLREALRDADAVILTGGVSMGDADYVPEAIRRVGGSIDFHRLPLRPGKPVLGATCEGKLILGLPGNPVSVAVTSRVVAEPLLNKLAGLIPWESPRPLVELGNADARTLDLQWYRLVSLGEDGRAHLVPNRGSGDVIALSRSSGFVEIPPGKCGAGPWRYWWW